MEYLIHFQCEREGTEAWSAALTLLELWDESDVKKSGHLVDAVARIVDEAAASGIEGATEASATLTRRIGGVHPKRTATKGWKEDVANSAGAAESGALF